MWRGGEGGGGEGGGGGGGVGGRGRIDLQQTGQTCCLPPEAITMGEGPGGQKRRAKMGKGRMGRMNGMGMGAV